ncbi:hypothetical protein FQA39_LY01050 [Lamprigera yunnana]|nr:hypothetical protein FQA39_LY01050 [Lamprigera yunnana]
MLKEMDRLIIAVDTELTIFHDAVNINNLKSEETTTQRQKKALTFIDNLRQGLRNSVKQINATSEIFYKYHETVSNNLVEVRTRIVNIDRYDKELKNIIGKGFDKTDTKIRLAIPVEQLSKYYKIDIADCTVAGRKIYIYIRVPIIQDALFGPRCAYEMFIGATVEELSKHCLFKCHTSKAMLISEINSDTFVITHVKNEAIIQCLEEKIEISDEAYNQPGALQVMLPCQYSLVVKSKEVISSRFPCTSEGVNPELIHVLPAIWSNLKTYVMKPTKHETIFKNMTECLDANWTTSFPHLNPSTTTLLNNFKESLEQTVSNHPYVLQGDATVYIWNIVLSIICTYRRGLAVLAIINPMLAFDTEEMGIIRIIASISSISLIVFAFIIIAMIMCYFITDYLRFSRHGPGNSPKSQAEPTAPSHAENPESASYVHRNVSSL